VIEDKPGLLMGRDEDEDGEVYRREREWERDNDVYAIGNRMNMSEGSQLRSADGSLGEE
jgi:hypothetical protein